jgi:hypothetical protein
MWFAYYKSMYVPYASFPDNNNDTAERVMNDAMQVAYAYICTILLLELLVYSILIRLL